jgi:hypothetical protein
LNRLYVIIHAFPSLDRRIHNIDHRRVQSRPREPIMVSGAISLSFLGEPSRQPGGRVGAKAKATLVAIGLVLGAGFMSAATSSAQTPPNPR